LVYLKVEVVFMRLVIGSGEAISASLHFKVAGFSIELAYWL